MEDDGHNTMTGDGIDQFLATSRQAPNASIVPDRLRILTLQPFIAFS